MGAPQSIKMKNQIYQNNIHKRGNVKTSLTKKPEEELEQPKKFSSLLVGFFLLVVIGGAITTILGVFV
jgi:hypothetical protein